MFTVSDIEPHIETEFGSRLEPLGFQRLAQRRWVRSHKLPIRELFDISALKGGQYSPVWGFSSGLVPVVKGRRFRRQSTDKNAIMDLVIDPIDTTGNIPPQAFSFITGVDSEVPIRQIRSCAEHFVPLAVADFNRIHTITDFCQHFVERAGLQYRRFAFYMYVQHQLANCFVLILTGRRDEGQKRIQEFCRDMQTEFDDPILRNCIRFAETFQTTA